MTETPLSRREFVWRSGSLVGTAAATSWTSLAHAQPKPTGKVPNKAAWQTLFTSPKNARRDAASLPSDGPIQSVKTLDLTGPHPGHEFQFGKFSINGEFGVEGGVLKRIEGRNAAMSAGSLDQFALEANVKLDGLGGVFFLLGWADGHGYLIYNVTMKKSGSPWFFCELRGGTAIADTESEIGRIEPKGPTPLKFAIQDGQLTLTVSDAKLCNELPLENYHPGELILGTYDTRYGPRDLQIAAMRVRSLPAKAS